MQGSPAIAHTLATHRAAVMRDGAVPELTKVLCCAMVAGLTDCRPLLIEYRARARVLGADAQTLTQLWNYAGSDRYNAAQKAALAVTVALTREPRALPGSLWKTMREHFDEAQIIELLCAIGLANYIDRVSNAVQTQISAHAQ